LSVVKKGTPSWQARALSKSFGTGNEEDPLLPLSLFCHSKLPRLLHK